MELFIILNYLRLLLKGIMLIQVISLLILLIISDIIKVTTINENINQLI